MRIFSVMLILLIFTISCISTNDELAYSNTKESSQIQINWEKFNDNVIKYKIYIDGIYREYTKKTSMTMFFLEEDTEYEIKVKALLKNGNEETVIRVTRKTEPLLEKNGLVHPRKHLTYKGAFRFPEGSGSLSNWNFMESDISIYPNGDSANIDSYAGSIFCFGNPAESLSAEISIPEPVKSKNVADLNRAVILKDFANVKSLNIQTVDGLKASAIEYLPKQFGQERDYLHTCFSTLYPSPGIRPKSYGAAEIDFSAVYGAWIIGSSEPEASPFYSASTSFIFRAQDKSDKYFLIAGGSSVGKSNWGPLLLAYSPWQDASPLPADNLSLTYEPILMYDQRSNESNYYEKSDTSKFLNGAAPGDVWRGGVFVKTEDVSAVIICGVKGHGDYFENSLNEKQSNYRNLLLFYDNDELFSENDNTDPNEIQPYAVMDLSNILFSKNSGSGEWAAGSKGPGGMSFNEKTGHLYMVEQRVDGTDHSRPIIHVWKIQ